MEKKISLIIDTDPGVDDAIALLYAIKSEKFDIKLLTTEGGNSPVQNITNNALHILDLLDAKIDVVQGYDSPLNRPAVYATGAQGKFGLGSYEYDASKLKNKKRDGDAVEILYDTLKSSPEKTTIISIGPMTNLAKLLIKYPDSKNYIEQIIFESGTKEKIIGKPYKSFNVGYDPEAAEIVLRSGVNLVMVPMELGHIAYLDHDDIKKFKNTNKTGRIYAKMFKDYHDFHVGNLGAAVHDVCTIFYLTHPELVKTEKAYIEIKYYHDDKDDFGYVNIDFNTAPNATVCMDLDIAKFKQHLFDALEKCK